MPEQNSLPFPDGPTPTPPEKTSAAANAPAPVAAVATQQPDKVIHRHRRIMRVTTDEMFRALGIAHGVAQRIDAVFGFSHAICSCFAGTIPSASTKSTRPGHSHVPPSVRSAAEKAVRGKVKAPQSGENPATVIQRAAAKSASRITMPKTAKPSARLGRPISPATSDKSAAGAK